MQAVVYVSSAVNLLSDQELHELLEKSRTHNRKSGITGMLLYKDGNFMQLLEGPREAVSSLLEKIETDPRHFGFLILLQQTKTEREFENWAMGFEKLEMGGGREVPGYSDFLTLPFTSDEFMENPSKALSLLLTFKKVVGL